MEPSSQTIPLTNHFLYSGFYANELLTYLLAQGDPVPDIFLLYEDLLVGLQAQADLETTLRIFEFSLLSELGYGIDFKYEALSGDCIDDLKEYVFSPEVGFILNADNQAPCFEGVHINAIANADFKEAKTKYCAKMISRIVLAHHLQGKKIKSRELFY